MFKKHVLELSSNEAVKWLGKLDVCQQDVAKINDYFSKVQSAYKRKDEHMLHVYYIMLKHWCNECQRNVAKLEGENDI